MKFGLGQPIRRREDVRFLKGEGQYVDDIHAPGDLYAYFLRSPAGHARIAGLDVSAAREAEGVKLVLTAAEIEGRLNPLTNDFPLETTGEGVAPAKPVTMPHLATDRVRFVGQPVAMVVAETLAQAKDAAELIELDLDELPVVVEQRAALEPEAPQLHDEAPGNMAYDWGMGDAEATDAAFAKAAKTVSVEVVNNRIVVASMEPRAARIGFDGERWMIHAGTQGSHNLKGKLARQLGVDAGLIRVLTPDVGGGFGMKLQAHPEDALIAIGAKDLGATIRWTAERGEAFLSDAQGRDLLTLAEGAFDADGRVLAMRFRSVSNLGAYYSTFGVGIHTFFSVPISGGMYDVPVWRHEVKGAFTNTTPTDAYRGAGRPEMIHITEQLMEAAAREFGEDRAAFRKKNLITSDQTPYTNHGGCVFDSADPARNVDDATAAADWDGFEARKAEAAARGKLAGIAAAYYFERTGGGPAESALMDVTPEGEITLAVGTQSTGQGHETVWPQIVHEELGVDPMKVRLLAGDSDVLTAAGGTGGSRSLIMASRVLMLAAEKVREQAMEGASHLLEAAKADIEYTVEDGGRYRIKGTDRSVTLFEAAAEMGGVKALGEVNDRVATFPNGCHVAEVELDPETGAVEIVRYAIADDFGRVVNPLLVEGQVHGGLVQGAGQVMGEVMVFDPDTAQPLSGSFMDYRMPRAADFPDISFKLNEVPCTTNPLGVKGCGEAGAVGAIPALALAIQDALLGAGVTRAAPPFTPVRVWSYLNAA
ncbi:xanthine dehydrogenase family protein molybdopterin-binding subunit [Albimonas sp. CAU 1670]|uniref:xanthine dehydrogenase family protein molybdopterin-binding subunit n=1 Tax=Albimonas sp. CAU 1670 TaxID=3032599 RepID=UPI0023D99BE9|nr:xanthine dehydrogenase family protein molybdopterin-binding subunit [Albimonas sp. CAU 1670]MDF2234480.1 xanthine dehydrogenase family protein molybdopterin-binding subunit [Albimonas sp. CAU 1670]